MRSGCSGLSGSGFSEHSRGDYYLLMVLTVHVELEGPFYLSYDGSLRSVAVLFIVLFHMLSASGSAVQLA